MDTFCGLLALFGLKHCALKIVLVEQNITLADK